METKLYQNHERQWETVCRSMFLETRTIIRDSDLGKTEPKNAALILPENTFMVNNPVSLLPKHDAEYEEEFML